MKDFLKQKLLYYMIPRFFVYLESFPLTLNCKVDVKKLAEYESQPKLKAPEIEAMDLEMDVERICQNVLNLFKNVAQYEGDIPFIEIDSYH